MGIKLGDDGKAREVYAKAETLWRALAREIKGLDGLDQALLIRSLDRGDDFDALPEFARQLLRRIAR